MDYPSSLDFPMSCATCHYEPRRFIADWYTKTSHHIKAVVIQHGDGLYIVKESMMRTKINMPVDPKGIIWLRSCGHCNRRIPDDRGPVTGKAANEVPADRIKGFWDTEKWAPAT